MNNIKYAILSLGVLSLITSGCSRLAKVTYQEVEKTVVSDRGIEMPVIEAEVFTAIDEAAPAAPVVPVKAEPVKAELAQEVAFVEAVSVRAVATRGEAVLVAAKQDQEAAVLAERRYAEAIPVEKEAVEKAALDKVDSRELAIAEEKKRAEIAFADPKAIDPRAAVELQPEAQAISYHVVTNQKILSKFREKMGTSYYNLEKSYKDAIANRSDISKIYELNLPYKFKVSAKNKSDLLLSDYVTFTPKDLFSGFGVFGFVGAGKFNAFGGVGRAYTDRAQTKVAIDFFQAGLNSKVFPYGSGFFGFQQKVGANIFSMKTADGNLTLSTLAVTLPQLAGASQVFSQRVSPLIANKLGTSVRENDALIFYTDANKNVLEVYALNSSNYVIKKVGQCQTLLEANLVDRSFGLNCARTRVPVIGVESEVGVPLNTVGLISN